MIVCKDSVRVRAVIGNESGDLNWGSCRDSTAWKARNSSNTNNSLSSNNNKTYCNQIFSMLKFLRKQCLFLVSSKPFGSIKPCFVRWNRPDIKQYKKNQKINGKFELKLRFLQIFISSTSKGITVSKKKSKMILIHKAFIYPLTQVTKWARTQSF